MKKYLISGFDSNAVIFAFFLIFKNITALLTSSCTTGGSSGERLINAIITKKKNAERF